MPKDAKSRRYIEQGDYVGAALHEKKHGMLHSGSDSGPKVTSRKQAIAIGLSMERQAKSAQDSELLGPSSIRGGHAGFGK